jgi:tRNA threonylcarbamoyladenosine biosynthesis protein TsaB
MTILAIDTSTQWCSVALFFSKDEFVIRHEKIGNSASQLLLPWIDEIIQQEQIDWDSIDAMAVSQGPGAFTGLRLGIGVAQGLAFAKKKPLIPIPSLDGMIAFEYLTDPKFFEENKAVHAVIDARMSEVYTAKYELQGQRIQRITEIHLLASEKLILEANSQYFIHDSSHIFGNLHVPITSILREASPHALGIALCASQMNLQQPFLPRDCQPLYIRDQVALTTQERVALAAKGV